MGVEPQGTAIPVPVARGLVQNILGSLTSGPAIYAMSLGDRTFVLHDGAAHLLGCCRQIIPQPQLACFSAQGQDEAPGVFSQECVEGLVATPQAALQRKAARSQQGHP